MLVNEPVFKNNPPFQFLNTQLEILNPQPNHQNPRLEIFNSQLTISVPESEKSQVINNSINNGSLSHIFNPTDNDIKWLLTISDDNNTIKRSTQRRIKSFEILKIRNFIQSMTLGHPISTILEMTGYYERLIEDDGSQLLLNIADEDLLKDLKKKLYIP